jgi:acyl-CoA dehydrogenase
MHEPDGRIGTPLLELKRGVQQASAQAGFYCAHLPPEDGGRGFSLVDSFYLQEEAFRHGLDGAQWSLAWTDGPSHLVRYWTAEARDRHLADFVAGRSAVAFALTEPGAGSDFPALSTSARRDGDGWILNGSKHLITAAPFAELAQVFARVDGAPRGSLTAFLVPLDAPGVERGPVQQTIMGDGQTGEIAFDDVRLEPSALIGQEGDGQRLAFLWINWTRTRRGGMCSGLAYHCLERSLAHSRSHEAFGRPIGEIGAVAAMLADIYMDWEAMRALSLGVLSRLDRGSLLQARVTAEDRALVSALKAWNDAALYRVADRAVQLHGGLGVLVETGLEKIFRVARNLRIPAGTEEVQRAVIADALLEAGVPGGAAGASPPL